MMFNRIGKSGTGIEKSGTGIEKSGTGIGKNSVWECSVRPILMLATLVGLLISGLTLAADSKVFVTERNDGLLVSMHDSGGIVAGFASVSEGRDGYYVIPLYSLLRFTDELPGADPQVVGSGSGKEVVGSGSGKEVVGSGSGKEVVGSGSGKEVVGSGSGKDVVGSGSGGAGEQCAFDPSLMVVGSGSGKEVVGSGSGKEVVGSGSGKEVVGSGSGKEVVGSGSGKEVVGSGSGKDVVGSGSGSSGEGQPGCEAMSVWGYAEMVVDADGTHIIVHQLDDNGLREFMVSFIDRNHTDVNAGQAEFVLTP